MTPAPGFPDHETELGPPAESSQFGQKVIVRRLCLVHVSRQLLHRRRSICHSLAVCLVHVGRSFLRWHLSALPASVDSTGPSSAESPLALEEAALRPSAALLSAAAALPCSEVQNQTADKGFRTSSERWLQPREAVQNQSHGSSSQAMVCCRQLAPSMQQLDLQRH